MNEMEDYVICRCEEVTLHDIQKAQSIGLTTSQEIKMATRSGMGMCQGRICRSLLEKIALEDQEGLCEFPSKLTIHKPVRPVPLHIVMYKGE